MKRKAWLAILFSLVMLVGMLSLTACGKKEEKKETEKKEEVVEQDNAPALPFDLKFGMSYDDFCDALDACELSAPAIEFENGGYMSDGLSLPLDDPSVWDFMGSDFLKRHASGEDFDPIEDQDFFITHTSYEYGLFEMYAKFDQDKQLRDIAVTWTAFTQYFVDPITEDITETYNEFFGTDGTVDTYSREWENDDYSVSFGWNSEEDGFAALIIHDKFHD